MKSSACYFCMKTKMLADFTERLFSVSKECVISLSHAFSKTYHKTLTKNLLSVRPEKVTRRKKKVGDDLSVCVFTIT